MFQIVIYQIFYLVLLVLCIPSLLNSSRFFFKWTLGEIIKWNLWKLWNRLLWNTTNKVFSTEIIKITMVITKIITKEVIPPPFFFFLATGIIEEGYYGFTPSHSSGYFKHLVNEFIHSLQTFSPLLGISMSFDKLLCNNNLSPVTSVIRISVRVTYLFLSSSWSFYCDRCLPRSRLALWWRCREMKWLGSSGSSLRRNSSFRTWSLKCTGEYTCTPTLCKDPIVLAAQCTQIAYI